MGQRGEKHEERRTVWPRWVGGEERGGKGGRWSRSKRGREGLMGSKESKVSEGEGALRQKVAEPGRWVGLGWRSGDCLRGSRAAPQSAAWSETAS